MLEPSHLSNFYLHSGFLTSPLQHIKGICAVRLDLHLKFSYCDLSVGSAHHIDQKVNALFSNFGGLQSNLVEFISFLNV